MQTYKEYLKTMKAYGFFPMDEKLWQEWQIYYHGKYKTENGTHKTNKQEDK